MKNLRRGICAVALVGVSVVSPVAAAKCAPGQQGFFGHGDGSTIKEAIVICGAKGEKDGVSAESAFLHVTFPGYKLVSQAVGSLDGVTYDDYTIVLPSGRTKHVFFDITDFFGKHSE